MGAFLDKPKTDKQTSTGTGNGLRYGVCSMQGWRLEMEDAHSVVLNLPDELSDWSFFAVFDGHAGPWVSAYCAENLLDSILQSTDFNLCNVKTESEQLANNELKQANLKVKVGMRDGFLALDEKMKTLLEVKSGVDKSGSTAVCALISQENFFFANCGDSRAVLCRNGKYYYSTKDHKPINPTEKERIQKAGGSVMIQRVNGSLAVSRALGDFEYKQVEGMGPCEQLVSPEPEINVVNRDRQQDEFLVLACDGIWDVINNQDLCDFIRYQLTIQNDLESICSAIIDTCFHKGSKDNMSVVLVVFDGAPKVSEEAQMADKRLNKELEKKIKEIYESTEKCTLYDIVKSIDPDEFENFPPPGGGVEAKRSFIEDVFYKLANEEESVNRSLPSSTTKSEDVETEKATITAMTDEKLLETNKHELMDNDDDSPTIDNGQLCSNIKSSSPSEEQIS